MGDNRRLRRKSNEKRSIMQEREKAREKKWRYRYKIED